MSLTWIADPNSELTGRIDVYNLTDGIAFSPDSLEGDATAFLSGLTTGNTLRAEVDGSNYVTGVVVYSSVVGAHYEVTLTGKTIVGTITDGDTLTVTESEPSTPSSNQSTILLLGVG
jgi:hypothetical protein